MVITVSPRGLLLLVLVALAMSSCKYLAAMLIIGDAWEKLI